MANMKIKVLADMPRFSMHCVARGGCLSMDREDHALWWYFITASANLKKVQDTLIYEGEKDLVPNYAALFQHAATFYGVDVNSLANRWPVILQEMERVNRMRTLEAQIEGKTPELYKPLPDELTFRNTKIIIS